jgi:hypothetical protein
MDDQRPDWFHIPEMIRTYLLRDPPHGYVPEWEDNSMRRHIFSFGGRPSHCDRNPSVWQINENGPVRNGSVIADPSAI